MASTIHAGKNQIKIMIKIYATFPDLRTREEFGVKLRMPGPPPSAPAAPPASD